MIYRIDGVNEVFRTLRDAKYYLSFYTQKDFESEQLQGTDICAYTSKGNALTLTPIKGYKDGQILYGKTYNIANKIARLNKLIGGTETRINNK